MAVSSEYLKYVMMGEGLVQSLVLQRVCSTGKGSAHSPVVLRCSVLGEEEEGGGEVVTHAHSLLSASAGKNQIAQVGVEADTV